MQNYNNDLKYEHRYYLLKAVWFMHIFFLLLLSSCSLFFRGNDAPKSAKNSQYTINFHSSDWEMRKDDRSDYVWENKKNGRILLSNSFCNEFQEQGLDVLAKKTVKTMSHFDSHKGDFTTFHDREAYRLEGNGIVDGVKVGLSLLNTRRNNCYFDFVSIAPLSNPESNDPEFNEFLGSVVFK
jgi:hypothetical protein